MGIPENEVAADNQRRRMDELSTSPVGGVVESAASAVRPALAVGSALVAGGVSATSGLAVAGSIVAGLGIVDWFRKLGSSKVNENLESLGQATEDALNRVESVLREHGASIQEIKARVESAEFKEAMASAALQALRTSQSERLKRMALILANGVKENDLEPESVDDMMRAAVELKEADIILLGKIYESQKTLVEQQRRGEAPFIWHQNLQSYWKEFVNSGKLNPQEHLTYRSSFSRLESAGFVKWIPVAGDYGVGLEIHGLLFEGKRFYERLQEIGTAK